ncbi:terminase [Gordonia phage PhorbesPhlower]|nr:terminase [Gordonia phage PhorbesPhlower]UUG69863.1 terminase [Gordonia phage Morkie]
MVAPADIASTSWPRVRKTCQRLGWGFDQWQNDAGRLVVAKRASGEYASDTIVLSIPRQVGKTYLVACIIFALCLIHPNLTVIWTAHRKTTAAETFRQFDGMAQKPKVAAHVRQVLRGKGDERILFNNGSRILFGARESGFGRGMTDVGILVLDEGQILPESTLEDMGATQNVAVNPLTFVMGTPPRPRDDGEFFSSLRQEAIDGESDGTLYIEFSADRGCDPMDRAQWRKANPSFPHRTSERALLRLRKKLKSDDSWNREALGIWDENTQRKVVTPKRWEVLADAGPNVDVRPDGFGVDMSHDRHISVGACWLDDDDAHVEEVWAGVDSAACIDWIVERAGKRTPVFIDAVGPANSLIPELKRRGVNVRASSAADMAKGCGAIDDRANKLGTITHGDQKPVTDALMAAKKRPIRDAGGWGWDRSDPSRPINPIVAVTLALVAALSTARRRRTGERRATVS